MSIASADFVTTQMKYLPEIVMCEADELDAKWDEFVQAVEDIPISTFVDYMQEQILKLVEQNS